MTKKSLCLKQESEKEIDKVTIPRHKFLGLELFYKSTRVITKCQ